MLEKRCQWFFLSRNPMMASQKLLRCASPFVVAAYSYLRLTPQGLRALHLELFAMPSILMRFSNVTNVD